MTFSETIDALIPIYEEGMKAKSVGELCKKHLHSGICMAAEENTGEFIRRDERFLKYCISPGFWFPIAFNMYSESRPISEIIDQCIRPRLELLKRIQEDLKTNESK